MGVIFDVLLLFFIIFNCPMTVFHLRLVEGIMELREGGSEETSQCQCYIAAKSH